MAFTGLPTEGIEFYEQLTADNSKALWQENMHRCVEYVKTPMVELADEFADFGPFHMFRPHNDLRFTKTRRRIGPRKAERGDSFENPKGPRTPPTALTEEGGEGPGRTVEVEAERTGLPFV